MLIVDGVEMLDVREAAQLAERTPETVRRWVWSGRVDAVKQGNRLLVARDQIIRLRGREGDGDRRLSLREWAADAAAQANGRRGTTASDLVLSDRASRS